MWHGIGGEASGSRRAAYCFYALWKTSSLLSSQYDTGHGGLTNYSLNSSHSNFVEDDKLSGLSAANKDGKLGTHKWSIEACLPHLPEGFDLHKKAGDILAMVSTSASLPIKGGEGVGTYELVGLDVMFDEGGKLWLLEVNINQERSDESTTRRIERSDAVRLTRRS